MKTELNFFNDESMANDPLLFEPYLSSELGLGMFQCDDELSTMARTMYSIAKSDHDQFMAKQAQEQELAVVNAEAEWMHYSGLGFPAPQSVLGSPVRMGVYHGGVEFDEPLYSVWNGVHGLHPFHLYIPNPNPNSVGEEHNLGLGLTRNFLGEMEPVLNPNHVSGALQLGSPEPEQLIVIDSIVKLEPENEEAVAVGEGEDLNLDLKL